MVQVSSKAFSHILPFDFSGGNVQQIKCFRWQVFPLQSVERYTENDSMGAGIYNNVHNVVMWTKCRTPLPVVHNFSRWHFASHCYEVTIMGVNEMSSGLVSP